MLFLNIIWHHHQPLYLDPNADQLMAPWVRTHATKDYYDMAGMLTQYPEIHLTVNLTASLLVQLQQYYVARLKPAVNLSADLISASKYASVAAGRIDPWMDLALKPTSEFDEKDLVALAGNAWNALGTTEVMLERFPEYKALCAKHRGEGIDSLSEQDRREIKFWFFLAHFDPDFLTASTTLVTGRRVKANEFVHRKHDGTYWLTRQITESDCHRIVCEAFKILEAVVPIHRQLMQDPTANTGQIEIITTPYYHPILPLICDSDVARTSQPGDPLPTRFSFPADSKAQVRKSVRYYHELFGRAPRGMWPAEGGVSQEVISHFASEGIRWIATDERILQHSGTKHADKCQPYRVVAGDQQLAILFRDTELSDKIGFVYQHWDGKRGAEDFVRHVLRHAQESEKGDRLLTVILDGENAWEWYRHDHDGKTFLHALYEELSQLQRTGDVLTVTPSEFISGNPNRGILPHPVESMEEIGTLWPGSWINANFDTWIGNPEKNDAWEYLRTARIDLEASCLEPPAEDEKAPRKGSKRWYALRAWEAMYAAEGSDWFWWYGTDQFDSQEDHPFDNVFLSQINSIYRLAKKAGAKLPDRTFAPITKLNHKKTTQKRGGTMLQSEKDQVNVLFQCDARGFSVPTGIFVAGNHPSLGDWIPNVIKLYDDGTHGDQTAGDGIWSLELAFTVGTVIEYKFTNGGQQGEWEPGEEFSYLTRGIVVDRNPDARIVLLDRFGTL